MLVVGVTQIEAVVLPAPFATQEPVVTVDDEACR